MTKVNVAVTIGICVKNCEKTIGETLDSILTQDYPHSLIEIIIVDDGCNDNTISIIMDKLSRSDLKFKILQTNGSGLGLARQKVVDHAEGKYVIWIDGDMVIPPDYIRKQVEFMELHPQVGRARAKWGWDKARNMLANLQFLAYIEEVRGKTQSKISGTGGSIFRISAIKDAGGFDTRIRGAGEDVDLAIRMLARGWDFAVSKTVFYHKPKTSWRDLWIQYLWYGYGGHYLSHKYRKRKMALVRPLPVAIAVSIRKAITAFKFTHKKSAFLLPIFFLISSLAWWMGFIKAHFEKYEPEKSNPY